MTIKNAMISITPRIILPPWIRLSPFVKHWPLRCERLDRFTVGSWTGFACWSKDRCAKGARNKDNLVSFCPECRERAWQARNENTLRDYVLFDNVRCTIYVRFGLMYYFATRALLIPMVIPLILGNSPGNNTGLVYAVDHFPSIGFTTHFYLSYKGTRLLQ